MTQYTLHKLPEGFIVTSNEQAKEGELGYIPFQGGDIKTVGKYFADDWKKVIAQQDQIDFSALTEEEQKEIGWFDVEKEAMSYLDKNYSLSYERTTWQKLHEKTYTAGFQKSQELLSDRRFTLDDMIDCFNSAREYRMKNVFAYDEARDYIQSLQPKSWTIEVETEEYVQEETGTELKWVGRRPKFTNGKIKILKIK
jgi:hypothetical protein